MTTFSVCNALCMYFVCIGRDYSRQLNMPFRFLFQFKKKKQPFKSLSVDIAIKLIRILTMCSAPEQLPLQIVSKINTFFFVIK